jgi:hypothetical protein
LATVALDSLPKNGETINARLFTDFGTAYAYTDHVCKAEQRDQGSNDDPQTARPSVS